MGRPAGPDATRDDATGRRDHEVERVAAVVPAALQVDERLRVVVPPDVSELQRGVRVGTACRERMVDTLSVTAFIPSALSAMKYRCTTR